MEKETKNCPYCGEKILIEAKKCKYCGEWLEDNSNIQNLELSKVSNINNQKINNKIPENINQWNWGAFLFTWIWGIANNSYLTLLTWIPFFGLIWVFVCGIKGNEWAWKNRDWKDIEHYNNVQRKWAKVSIAITVSVIVLTCMLCTLLMFVAENTEKSNDTFYNSQEIAKEIGVSKKCYEKYQTIFNTAGQISEEMLPCSDRENKKLKEYFHINGVKYKEELLY